MNTQCRKNASLPLDQTWKSDEVKPVINIFRSGRSFRVRDIMRKVAIFNPYETFCSLRQKFPVINMSEGRGGKQEKQNNNKIPGKTPASTESK